MNSDKNLQASIPQALLAQMKRAAEAEHISVDELVRNTVESRLNRREWQETLLFGERQAKSRHLTEDDLQEAIAAVRSRHADS